MSRHGEITLLWGDGEYKFRLGLGEVRQLQEMCDAGPPVIARRLRGDDWKIDDYRETLRLGLIGGGMPQPTAVRLVRKFVDERPPHENLLHAWAVLQAFITGASDETVGKLLGSDTVATKRTRRSRTEKSASPISSDMVQ